MAGQGESSRPSMWRVVCVSLATVAAVLWVWSGWTWWVVVPLVGGLVVARLLIGLFPPDWRPWASNLALVIIADLVVVWLLWFTPLLALGVAIGAGALVCVAQLRDILPPQAIWAAVGASVALMLACGLTAWLSWMDLQQTREANERAEREYRQAELRPDKPLQVLHQVVKAVHDDDAGLVCFLFTGDAERQFAEDAGADSCEDAITALHDRITGKGYGNATAGPNDVTAESRGKPAAVSGCDMYMVDGPLEYLEPPGPALGTLRLERDPKYPTGGYLITRYTPCGETDPDIPTTSSSPPAILPSYPPAYPRVLASAIAAKDQDVCDYFTRQGATQFAAIIGAGDCPAAIEALAGQLTDPTAYANPDGVTVTTTGTGPNAVITVHACALTWSRYGQGTVSAGPQLGHLTLTRPDTHDTGYMIDAVRPCP